MARKAEQPVFVPPMMPVTADAPPAGGDWLHELAYDGCRAQLLVGGDEARAFSAGGEDWTDRCRPLSEAAAALGCRAAAIDGEMIVEDADGRPDPAALQAAIAGRPERLVFMAFDLLHLDGRDLRAEPIEVRRALLEELVGARPPAGPIRFSVHVEAEGPDFLRAVESAGLPGIVSKKRASRYRSGVSRSWIAVRALAHPAPAQAPGLKAIPGSAKPGGEPSYKKPKLPEKRLIVDYYRRMAPLLLGHAARRPLNLFRCTAGHCFYQRNRNHPASGATFGPPIRFVPIAQKNERIEDYLYVEDEAGLIACAEADVIEFHGWGSRAPDVERPDRIAFDLDPGEGTGFAQVKEAALTMRRVLRELGLDSFALLSGGKGIHVVVPVEPEGEWAEVREFARRVSTALARAEPERFTVSLPKAQRKGRIFLDYLRNQRTATAILPWSLRARLGAPVAAPVAWTELGAIDSAATFTIGDVPALLRRARSSRLAGWGEAAQRLPRLG